MRHQMSNKQTELIRVLQSTGALNMGGAETMIMNVYREIDKSSIQFDFVVAGNETGYYENEATELGAHIHHITKRSDSLFHNLKDFYCVVKSNKYQIIHFHTQNAFLTVTQIIAARLAGARKIIVHSHSTQDWRSDILKKLHKLFRPVLNGLTTVKLSCGEEAALWLYGTNKNVQIIPNPVACDNYTYSYNQYCAFRKENGINLDATIYAHIGRFADVKNHVFLIDLFYELYYEDNNSILFLMGDGELKEAIQKKVVDLGLESNVVFWGNINDVNKKLIMADAFLFPSKYEGFPNVVLEAQAAGLPCFVSDTVTSKVAITDLVMFFSIEDNPQNICTTVRNTMTDRTSERASYNKIVREQYDVSAVTDRLKRIYREE